MIIQFHGSASVRLLSAYFQEYIDKYIGIHHLILVNFLHNCWNLASPKSFLSPASMSGKYHAGDEKEAAEFCINYNYTINSYDPENTLIKEIEKRPATLQNQEGSYNIHLVKPGGQTIHLMKVVKMSVEAARRWGSNGDNSILMLSTMISALCHDIVKFQETPKYGWTTVKTHPEDGAILMDKVMNDMIPDFLELGSIGTTYLSAIKSAILGVRYHYGIWDKDGGLPAHQRATLPVVNIIQEADYYASRDFVKIDTEFPKIDGWEIFKLEDEYGRTT